MRAVSNLADGAFPAVGSLQPSHVRSSGTIHDFEEATEEEGDAPGEYQLSYQGNDRVDMAEDLSEAGRRDLDDQADLFHEEGCVDEQWLSRRGRERALMVHGVHSAGRGRAAGVPGPSAGASAAGGGAMGTGGALGRAAASLVRASAGRRAPAQVGRESGGL